MTHKLLIPVFATVLGSLFLLFGIARAQNPFPTITFPIAELGSCTDLSSCKSYCDVSGNATACIAYARAHGLSTTPPPPSNAPTIIDRILQDDGGPGGCSSRGECKMYCEDVSNLQTCIAFGKTHKLLSKTEIAEGEKIMQAMKRGVPTPGSCTTRDSCENYCQDSAHVEECLDFARKAGTLGKDELDRVAKFQQLISSGGGPGGCTSANTCRQYCQDQTHRRECIAFGTRVGFISHPEAARMMAVAAWQGPGGCNSAESCAAFCGNPATRDVCIQFGQNRGLHIGQEMLNTNSNTSPFPGDRRDGQMPPRLESGKFPPRPNATSTRAEYMRANMQYPPGTPSGMTPEQIQHYRGTYPQATYPPRPGITGPDYRYGATTTEPRPYVYPDRFDTSYPSPVPGTFPPAPGTAPYQPSTFPTAPGTPQPDFIPPPTTGDVAPQSFFHYLSTMTANALSAVMTGMFQYLLP